MKIVKFLLEDLDEVKLRSVSPGSVDRGDLFVVSREGWLRFVGDQTFPGEQDRFFRMELVSKTLDLIDTGKVKAGDLLGFLWDIGRTEGRVAAFIMEYAENKHVL